MTEQFADPTAWYPIARSDDAVDRHIYQGQLLGRELAVWRADDGFVNVWENRCLHRGVRLTVGRNDGRELRCQYHGWRYANRTGGCTYIPAHPANAPARTICTKVFPAVERYGLIWAGEAPVGDPPSVPTLDDGEPFGLRNLPFDAPADLVLAGLESLSFPSADGDADSETRCTSRGAHWIELTSRSDATSTSVVFFVQPLGATRSVVRPVATRRPSTDRIAFLRHHATLLAARRDEVESVAKADPVADHDPPALELVDLLDHIPEPSSGRRVDLRVVVARKWPVAEGVAGFELEPIDGQLPTFQPGAHIDVHLPNGMVRQYSITNSPGVLDRYTIAVKREPESRGGSACLHETVREGDLLAISAPRNNFPLRRDSDHTVLIAGGIGITPLLAMARALHHHGLSFHLHCFARSEAHLPFSAALAELGDAVVTHLGLDPGETTAELADIVAAGEGYTHVYVCGPGPMLDATRRLAADAGRPDDTVHFEYFANPHEIDDRSSFEVSLARSALTFRVQPGQSVLDALRTHGVSVPSSCEQGACGTCMVSVVEGEPDHQDVYLNDSERRAGDRMLTCVSRSLSDRLVLDV